MSALAVINSQSGVQKSDPTLNNDYSRSIGSKNRQHNTLDKEASQINNSFDHNEFISLAPDDTSQKNSDLEWDESLPPASDGDEQNFSTTDFILPKDLKGKESEQLIQQRQTYKAAIKALNRGRHQTYTKLRKKLDPYPLSPYLDYYELRRYLNKASQKDIDSFILNNSDLAVLPHLKKAWLQTLARKKRWPAYLDFYENVTQGENPVKIKSAKLNCHYHWSQFKTGEVRKAFDGANTLWLVGKSQDKACDSLFKKWMHSNLFNNELIWQRIQLAIHKRQYTLARFLGQSLDHSQQKRVNTWINLYQHPERLIEKSPYLEDTIERNGMVFNILMRLIDRNPVKAIDAWELYEAKLNFSDFQNEEFKSTLATILELRGLPEAEQWLYEANPGGNNPLLNQLAIRRALTKSDWNSVANLIEKLPETQKYSSQSRYWYARALESIAQDNLAESYSSEDNITRNNKDTLQAEIIYQQLASERSYYGFLASQRSQLPMRLVPMPVSIQNSEIVALNANPALLRAFEFYHLGQYASGRREWNAALSRLNDKQKLVAAKLASEKEWHSEAIRSVSKSSFRDRLKLRFPLAHNETVQLLAEKTGLTSEWIYAIIRQESMFMPDARSSAGATGMMQLLPGTARLVAREENLPYRGTRDLLNPDKNITLGAHYLSQLMERFNNNIVLATAAYNAGPHRVDRWLANEHYPDNIPGDVWIEMIPYKETRHYVKQVLAFQAIYQHLMGDEPDLLSYIQVISSNIDSDNITTATD